MEIKFEDPNACPRNPSFRGWLIRNFLPSRVTPTRCTYDTYVAAALLTNRSRGKNAIARRFLFFSFFFFFFNFVAPRERISRKGEDERVRSQASNISREKNAFFSFSLWTTGRPIECLSSFAIRVETVARLLRITVFRTSRVAVSLLHFLFVPGYQRSVQKRRKRDQRAAGGLICNA